MIFAEIGPIQKTVNSYKNHEFIPPHGETKSVLEAQLEWRRDSMSEEVRIWVSELRGCSVERM